MIDYNKEVEKIEAYVPPKYWKPKAGKYNIVPLREIEEGEPYNNNGSSKSQEKFELKFSTKTKEGEAEEFIWTFARGAKDTSIFAQLCKIGKENDTLIGKPLTVDVDVSENGKNSYTIY